MKSAPIISMTKNAGMVSITYHSSVFMYQPLVKDLITRRNHGTICVLTQTNEEAVILMALLRKEGLNSKLIQSMDGFRFWNMAEVRFFLKLIENDTHSSIIADHVWENAKQKTFSTYINSSSICYLQKCIQLFEDTYKAKYLTDFKDFVFESSVEDFCDTENADVVVSTIHKSKGMEFDDVYMLISEPRHITEDILRRYYVGITRAKQRLFVHTNSSVFDVSNAVQRNVDQNLYKTPNDIVLQLSHKDVNLGFFKSKKKEILALRAGQSLVFDNNYLFANKSNSPICQLSHKMQEDLYLWYEKGYAVSSASIRFIVAWKPKDAPKEEREHAVVLVDLTMSKNSHIQETP